MTDSTAVKRIKVLGVPVDILDPEDFADVVWDLIRPKKYRQIILLTFAGFFKARRNQEFRKCLNEAALVIPVSRRIIGGAKFLKRETPHLYMPFPFVIKLLGHLERMNQNIYILGGNHEMIQISESTLRSSFPKLQFIGRCNAGFNSSFEKNVLLAIQKSAPTLLLAGKGLKGRDLWLFRRKKQLNSGIALWDKECYNIFSGKKKRPPESTAGVFIKEMFRTTIQPWRLFYIFLYFWYVILLVFQRIKEGRTRKKAATSHSGL